MRLTKKKAIELSIELWTWLAETGEEFKSLWSGWDKYGEPDNDCFLCEYQGRHETKSTEACSLCPYYKIFGDCTNANMPYENWWSAETIEDRKKYAREFLEQLKQL